VFPLVRRGFNKVLELEDLGKISPELEANYALQKLKHSLRSKNMEKISLLKIFLMLSSSKLILQFLVYSVGQFSYFFAAVSIIYIHC